ncbi:MAG: ribosome maturation factor RimM [Deltaproteobacteria bacterium]|jgi:16S rRNA processing protein RimM|nr:ribosome maturation factor RimM [Deltaproteobacteria bacterium]
MDENKFIPLGYVSRTVGVSGVLLVKPFGGTEGLLSGRPLYLARGGRDDRAPGKSPAPDNSPDADAGPVPLSDYKLKAVPQGVWLKLKSHPTREKARELVGRQVGVWRGELPPPEEGEYYLADLMHLEARTESGRVLGTVEHLMETGASGLVLVIQDGRGGETLVPFTEECVPEVDLAGRMLTVAELPGLLD